MNNTFQEDLLNIDELRTSHSYGTFWPRFWALLIDGLILAVLTPLTIYNTTQWKNSPLLLVIACIQMAYKPFFEYVYSATPGKMALRLKVVNYEYSKASLNGILLRNIFGIAGSLISVVLRLFIFYQPVFLQNLPIQSTSVTNIATMASVLVGAAIFIIYLVDLGFLLSSAESRSLHDRIGKTFVIKE